MSEFNVYEHLARAWRARHVALSRGDVEHAQTVWGEACAVCGYTEWMQVEWTNRRYVWTKEQLADGTHRVPFTVADCLVNGVLFFAVPMELFGTRTKEEDE